MQEGTYLELVVLISVGGYLLGSVLFAKFLPRVICGIDIEAVSEDGNPGTSNVMKHCGVPLGILTGICELGKGFVPVAIAEALIPMDVRTPVFGLVIASGILGHMFSLYHHGKGGMGAAPFWGTLMAIFLQSQIIFFLIAIYIVVRWIIRVHPQHLRTILCFGIFLVVLAIFCTNPTIKPAYLTLCAIVCVKCLFVGVRNGDLLGQTANQE